MIVSSPYNLPAGLPTVAYRSVPDSVAGMVEHVAQVQRALTAPVWYAPRFAALFGGTRWNADQLPSLGFGSNRAADPVITRLICEQVHAKSAARVLEIGAGTSLGSARLWQFGAPWLSRSLQIALQDRVRIVATDLTATDPLSESPVPVHIVVRQGCELNFFEFRWTQEDEKIPEFLMPKIPTGGCIPLSHWCETKGSFDEVPKEHSQFNFLDKLWTGECEALGKKTCNRDLHFYVIPSFNPRIESHVFGLDVAGGRKFDFTRLHTNRPFSDKKFDAVFGRFQARLFWSAHWGAVEAGAESLVAEGGKYYIEVDGSRPIQNLTS